GHAPHIAPEAWLHELFAPLKKTEIATAEENIGYSIPKDFAEFLLAYNGLNLFSTSLSIYGIRKKNVRSGDDVWQPFDLSTPNVFERPSDSTDSQFFIGGYNWDGSKLFIDNRNRKVFRCTRDSAKPLNHWEDFGCMLISECNRIAELYDG